MAEEDERLGRRRGGQPAAGEELHAPRAPHVLLLRREKKKRLGRKSPDEKKKEQENRRATSGRGRRPRAMRGAGSSSHLVVLDLHVCSTSTAAARRRQGEELAAPRVLASWARARQRRRGVWSGLLFCKGGGRIKRARAGPLPSRVRSRVAAAILAGVGGRRTSRLRTTRKQ